MEVQTVEALKNAVKKYAEIAGSLPENLQAICFELLLRDYLNKLTQVKSAGPKAASELTIPPSDAQKEPFEEATKAQGDITNADLHIKQRKFMEKYSVTIDELNNLFYKEGEGIRPLYEDLKTTRLSEGQVRIALLQCLYNGIKTGEFQSDVDTIRKECVERKCYDSPNFTANFKNNKSLFDFAKYTKDTKTLRLSETGKKSLAQLIKEMQ